MGSRPADDERSVKTRLRQRLLAARRALDPAERATRDRAIVANLTAKEGALPAGTVVAAFVPTPGEPGGPALPERLRAAGAEVWLPVSPAVGPLGWAEYDGPDSVRVGRFAILEPAGPVVAATALTDVTAVLVPALAIGPRGERLGRGGGYYDRTLGLLPASAERIGVVDDAERLDDVPCEEHDLRVTAVCTPAGMTRLPPA